MSKFDISKYINDVSNKQKQILIAEQGILINYLDLEVCQYLEPRVKNLLRDAIVLIGSCRGIVVNDFSYLVSPAYKALEGFMIQLATDFNIYNEKDKNRIGNLFVIYNDEEEIYSEKEKIITAIKEKTGGDKEALVKWNDLARAQKLLRHSPAHFGKQIDTYDKADSYVKSIILAINGTAAYFLEKGYLGESVEKVTPDIKEEDDGDTQKRQARTS